MNIELTLEELKMINKSISYSMFEITLEDVYNKYDDILYKLKEIEYNEEEKNNEL